MYITVTSHIYKVQLGLTSGTKFYLIKPVVGHVYTTAILLIINVTKQYIIYRYNFIQMHARVTFSYQKTFQLSAYDEKVIESLIPVAFASFRWFISSVRSLIHINRVRVFLRENFQQVERVRTPNKSATLQRIPSSSRLNWHCICTRLKHDHTQTMQKNSGNPVSFFVNVISVWLAA